MPGIVRYGFGIQFLEVGFNKVDGPVYRTHFDWHFPILIVSLWFIDIY